ncbi:uncharacterized protein EDB91DRAFT_1247577 [Suillus paluster]|uniref:uncharacterized protein n=1 Tax=Suillus paluster TaxID=48578 RepID=UPI001B87E765|nr:uncharacterized protein EDB91DRAFT_1247577 [Suillus paluster]KAG1742771.1 hypothetical protein EDB91DRAFT_1247577 [Suillus paluster]
MHAATSAKKQKEYIDKLEAEIDILQKRIGEDESAEAIVSRHISLLHRYNEAKDAAQLMLCVEDIDRKGIKLYELAASKETTVRQIHIDMDLMDDQ